ncbi:MAG: hypothetical protein FJX97_03710 [Bacteroidetes bacterium]|nr:hypothetical protein [Bacteroidota bacterium]
MKGSSWILVFLISWCSVHLATAQEKATLTQLELGLLGGKSKALWSDETQNRLNFSFSAFHGKEIKPNHYLGFNLGVDAYPEISLIPIGLGWRGFLGDDVGPRWMGGLNAGFGTTFLEERERTEWSSTWREGGVYFHPFLGVTLPAKKGNWALTSSLGFKWQPSSLFEGTHSQPEIRPKIHPFWTRASLPEGFNSLNKVTTHFQSLSFQVGILF